jgi:hypothetical protein
VIAWTLVAALLGGCAGTPEVVDPLADLERTGTAVSRHEEAMRLLDADPTNADYVAALHKVIWKPGYAVEVREAALARLEGADLDGLKRTIRQRLPQMTLVMWPWLTRLCETIAARGWTDLTPALVSSWARPIHDPRKPEHDRPEYQALAALYGAPRVTDIVFETFVSSRRVADQGLRRRCWELLHRLGERERLVRLLIDSPPANEDDLMLADLQAAATDLGIVPFNGEEILWIRKLRQPDRAAFWSQAVAATGHLSDSRKASLELRAIPIIVSAALHEPRVLDMDEQELYALVDEHVKGRKHHHHQSNYDSFGGGSSERLADQRESLTWGDLAAMRMAIRAIDVPQVAAHLFAYAQRDQDDESTEFGGVIRLDEKGRFEILEFPPTFRRHDREFISSQAMMDAGYTSLFHFHMHVQSWRNESYAGPSTGDHAYADNTRTNCLVFTAVDRNTLNVDFYRHHGVIVDLGEVQRPVETRQRAIGDPAAERAADAGIGAANGPIGWGEFAAAGAHPAMPGRALPGGVDGRRLAAAP